MIQKDSHFLLFGKGVTRIKRRYVVGAKSVTSDTWYLVKYTISKYLPRYEDKLLISNYLT